MRALNIAFIADKSDIGCVAHIGRQVGFLLLAFRETQPQDGITCGSLKAPHSLSGKEIQTETTGV